MTTLVAAVSIAGRERVVPSPPTIRVEAERQVEAAIREGRLSPELVRGFRAALENVRETVSAARAFHDTLEEPTGGLVGAHGVLAPEHTLELETFAQARLDAELATLLSPAQMEVVRRRLTPLSSFFAAFER